MPSDAPALPESVSGEIYATLERIGLRAQFVNAEAWPGDNRQFIKSHPVAGPLWSQMQAYHADHSQAMRLRELHRVADFRIAWFSVVAPRLIAWSATFSAESEGESGHG